MHADASRGTRVFPALELVNADPRQLVGPSYEACFTSSVAALAMLIVVDRFPYTPTRARPPSCQTGAAQAAPTSPTTGMTAEPRRAYNWSGAYFGFTPAPCWHVSHQQNHHAEPDLLFNPLIVAASTRRPATINALRFHRGLQAGYNWQFGRALIRYRSRFQLSAHGWRSTTSLAVQVPGGHRLLSSSGIRQRQSVHRLFLYQRRLAADVASAPRRYRRQLAVLRHRRSR